MKTKIWFRNCTPSTVDVFWENAEGKEQKYAELQPYGHYLQSTYAGHRWIVRERTSQQRVGKFVAKRRRAPYDIRGTPRSKESVAATTLTLENSTPLAVAVYWIDFDGEERHFANLRPGDEFRQETYAGHPWRVRALACGTEIDLYVPTAEPEQRHAIALRSWESTHPVTLTFRNRTHLSLRLEWMDFEGHAHPYTVIAPNAPFEQATYASHPWLLRDEHSGIVVQAFPNSFANTTHDITADRLRSLGGVQSTNLSFQNLMPFPIDLYWVDFAGEEKRYATLRPGEFFAVSSYAGHPWTARKQGTSELVGRFIPAGTPSQHHAFSYTALNGAIPARLALRNESSLPVKLFLAGDDGEEYKLSDLAPKEREDLPLYDGARLIVRDAYSDHLMREVTVSAGLAETAVTALDPVSAPDTPAVRARLSNETPFDLDFFWVDFEGKETHYASLAPGESYVQETMARHVWRARDRYTKRLIGLFIANDAAEQQSAVRVRSYQSHVPTGVSFVNESALSVDILWLDYSGRETPYQTLEPGGSTGFKTFVTHPWIVRDKRSRRLLDWTWGDSRNQLVTINDHDIKPREGSHSVAVTFENNLPFAVDLFWIDYDGGEERYATLEPGDRHVQSTFETHPWRVRQQLSGDEIALYIADAATSQVCPLTLRSQHSEVATEIEFVNLSPLTVGLFWLDYQGKEVPYGQIPSRESRTIDTFMTHPWIVRDVASGETVGFTVGLRERQVFQVSGAVTRSRKDTKPVALELTNGTEYDVDVEWIDFDGNEKNYGRLSPGASLPVSTFMHHAWRMRESASKTELDLYITSAIDRQNYRIKNSLIRTRERKDARLWDGEVALYEHDNYQGRVWILHTDLADFRKSAGMNDSISSLRLGPNTAVTLFRDSDYQGINDVFHLDTPSLGQSDVGHDSLSSLQLLTTLPQQSASIKSTSRLTEEVEGGAAGLVKRPVLRSVVTLPPLSGDVEVWATEELQIEVGKNRYTIDPVKPARLRPNSVGKLIINIAPDTLGKAALMLRTAQMRPRERFFVFPDVDVHTKILQMGTDHLWGHRNALGIDRRFSRADVGQVQTAIQALSTTVPAATRSLSHGVGRDRFVVTDRMPYAAWALELGGANRSGAALFRPVPATELADINRHAERVDERAGQGVFDFFNDAGKAIEGFFVETIPRAAETAVLETAEFVTEDVGGALVDAGKAVVEFGKNAGKVLGDTAQLVWDETSGWVEQAAKDTGKFIESTAKQGVEFLEDAVAETTDFFEEIAADVKEALEAALETVVRVTVKVAGQLYQFVVETVEKIGKFVQKVIEEIGVGWSKFVEFLKDVFAWEDVLVTHDHIIAQINGGIDLAEAGIAFLRDNIQTWLSDLKEEIVDGVDRAIDNLGASDIASQTRTGGLDTSEVNDKLDWLMSLLIGDDAADGPRQASEPADNPLRDKISDLIPEDLKRNLSRLLLAFTDRIKHFVDQDLTTVIDAFLDGAALFQAALDQPARAQQLVLSAVLSLVKGLLVTGLGVIDVVISTVFEFVLAAIDLLQVALNATLDIPVLSALYRTITGGRELSAISLLALLVAVPATVISKLVLGRAPFQNAVAAGQSTAADDKKKEDALKQTKRDWAIVYGTCHYVLLATDLFYDIKSATNKQTSPATTQTSTEMKTMRIKDHKERTRMEWQYEQTTVTKVPAKFEFQGPFKGLPGIDPKDGFGKTFTAFQLVSIVAIIFAQVAGNPAGHPGGLSTAEMKKRYKDADEGLPKDGVYWSNVVWGYQWIYLGIASLDFFLNSVASSEDGEIPDKVGLALAVITTFVGLVHCGLMAKLVDVDLRKDGGYTARNGTRHAGWMFDTLPAISKFCTLQPLNESTDYWPLAIHCLAFVTLGHLGEASVYFVRAGRKIDDPDYDL